MSSLPFSLVGSTLLVGESNVGKTRLTARAIETIDCGSLVVLDFAPERWRDGQLLGGRLTRFTTVPTEGWYGVIEAHAPRADGESDAQIQELAAINSDNAIRLLDAAPDPTVVFVNDATIPFQSGDLSVHRLTDYCDRADTAVLNALDSDLGTDHPVSRHERNALTELKTWADRTIELTKNQ